MPASVTVELDTQSVLQRLDNYSKRIGGGLGPDWAGPALSMELAAIEREWFESQGAGAWPPLSPATIVSRANRWGYYASTPAGGVTPSGPILQWTGRLKESLGDPRGRGSGDAFIRMSPNLLEQGTMVPYAIYHQNTRPPVKPLDEKDEARLMKVFAEYVLGEDGL